MDLIRYINEHDAVKAAKKEGRHFATPEEEEDDSWMPEDVLRINF